MRIESSAFRDGERIPERYTCEGADVSPPLAFTVEVPAARTLALVVDDPDAPGGTWVHWLVYDLPATTASLPEAVAAAALPGKARFGSNSWRRAGWGGPCPPSGNHHYLFTLYALDTELPELRAATHDELARAMAGHVLGEASLTATFSLRRPGRHAASRA